LQRKSDEPVDGDDDAWMHDEADKLVRRRRKMWGGKVSYDEPIITGDPVADEWERQIARGEVPDL
jgi:hypothetical protein